jgi:hypothetical protein
MLLLLLCFFLFNLFISFQVTLGSKRQNQQHDIIGSSDLPVLPASLPAVNMFDESRKKHVPNKMYIAVRDRKDQLPGHLYQLFDRNPSWEFIICDNACKDDFMYTMFANTSVAWAYSVINPLVYAAKADIWRYAVLYTYGGVYLDDDSDIKDPLDEVIRTEDRLIMSEEGSSSLGDCYIPTYTLSDKATYHRFPNYSTAVHYSGLGGKEQTPTFFHDHTLVNWGIFTRPRHPLFLRTLQHIVEIITTEYQRVSVIHLTRWDVRWKQVMCSTGFVLTYTTRELELENSLAKEDIPRISVNNYKEYKGNVKAIWTGGDPNHYMKAMQRKGGPILLRDFAPLDIAKIKKFLEGRTVMGDGGKEIYLVHRGKLMTFPNYDLFISMNFSDKTTRHVSDHVLGMIPKGGELSEAMLKEPVKPLEETAAPEETSSRKVFYTEQDKNYLFLSKVRNALDNSSEIDCFGDDYDGTRDDVLQQRWKKYVQDPVLNPDQHSVMIFPFCLRTFQLGNTLGYYLNDIACADISGSHFLAVKSNFNIIDPKALVASGNAQMEFFQALPNLIIHPSPNTPSDVNNILKTKCHCLQFCWENSEAPWTQRLSLIKHVLIPAIDAYTKHSHGEVLGTILNNATDYSTLPFSAPLPLIPNVTIQYRCGDNVGFGKTKYGLLPFAVYRRFNRIPAQFSKYIYVIADSPTRSANHPYSNRCDTILKHLFDYLKGYYPQSVIVVKRGGDPFLDYTRIAYSSVVFCSASTFCLWPALANSHGNVYYPLTPLIAKAGSNETAPNFGPRFHWISEVPMIKEFKHYRPWSALVTDLETKEWN